MNGQYRWAILASLTALQAATSVSVSAYGPLAPFLQEGLGISRAQVGLFASAVYLGGLVMSIPAGWLVDRMGIRRTVVLGPLLLATFFALFSRAGSFHAAVLLIVLSGLGYGFINPVTTKALLLWFSPQTRATAISIKQTGVTGGGAIAAAVLPSLAIALSWRGAVPLVSLVIVLTGVACVILYRNPPSEAKRPEQKARPSGMLRQLFTDRNMMLLGAMSALLAIVHFSVATHLVLFFKDSLSFSVVVAGSYLAAAQLGGTAGRVVWAVVSDRLLGGSRKQVFYLISLPAAAIALVLAFLSAYIPAWLLLPLVVLLGFTALAWQGVYLTMVGEMAGPERAGTAVGWGATVGYTGILVGPPLFGYLVDTTGSYTWAWLMLAFCAVGACALLLPVKETKAHARIPKVPVPATGGNPSTKATL